MGTLVDIAGQTFGRLTVLSRAAVGQHGQCAKWVCRCECGATKEIIGKLLRTGKTRSCGCLRAEQIGGRVRKHGASHTQEFYVWQGMKARCLNPKHKAFKDYGGRGITVCDAWLNSYEQFLSDMGPRPRGLTIERINNDGNYEPSNCKWATRLEQRGNRRDTADILEEAGVMEAA